MSDGIDEGKVRERAERADAFAPFPQQAATGGGGEATLLEAQRTVSVLRQAIAARDQFISGVGIELRRSVAPLMLLADHFEMIAGGGLDERVPRRAAILTKSLHKFVATVDRVAEIAHLRDGKIHLNTSDVNLTAEVVEIVARMKALATAGGVDLAIEAPEAIPGRWDRARVHQIVSNLISNAIRYAGPGVVDVSVRRCDQHAELTIRDRGPGIPDDELGTVFDRFDHPMPSRSGGFGIGLFVVKALTVAMGGRVSADVPPDGGARFRVMLPVD